MVATPDEDDRTDLTGDQKILHRARSRFKRCQEWFGEAYKWWLEDSKFGNADDRNHHQWPDQNWQDRDDTGKPTLTINKVRTHNNIVVNESLQQKSSITVRPTGGTATYESAQAMQAAVRRIEAISRADAIYEKAIRDQIYGGFGFVMIDTRYMSERTNKQDIYLKRCKDPLNVYTDPDCEDPCALDGNFGFEFDPMSREKFNKKYPAYKDKVGQATTLGEDAIWITNHSVMVAMYYEKSDKKDKLVSFTDPNTQKLSEKLYSEVKEAAGREILDGLITQIENGEIDGEIRDVFRQEVKWYLIAGDFIMKRGDWPGKYVPIVKCVGDETCFEGSYDCKSMTRYMISAQQMLNYNASASIEYGALQTKSPYIGPARAFEANEVAWSEANIKNAAYLTYNDIDEEAPPGMEKIDRPQREQPPQGAPVYMQGMQDAERQLMMVSGQYQAQLGENDQQSAASGKAINERQRQGDTATYHFVEHQADMYRGLGMQMLDLIPKIYDTERLLSIEGEDGTKQWVKIAPDQEEAIIELRKEGEKAQMISLNPNVGEYDCIADAGPSYATQRQEAWNAISIILQQNMQLAGVIGDILFRNGDFAGADELAERMKKEIETTKPYLFDDGQHPAVAAMQLELQKQQKLNGDLMQKLSVMQIAIKSRDEKRDIEASRAETDRLKVLVDALKVVLAPDQRELFEQELAKSTHDTTLDMIREANSAQLGASYSNGAAAQ